MRSTFSGLTTAVSGIYANQIGIDTVGHNVTNASTDGYSRQRVNLVTTSPESLYTSSGRAQIGTGVDTQSITRTRDTFIDQQMWKESSSLGYGENTVDILGRIEGVFSISSKTGLQSVFDKFWDSWQTLSTNASDDGCRITVRQRGVEMVDAIQHAAQQLKDINNDINSSIELKVSSINQYLSEIGSLNKQIVNVESTGDHANDLRDRRDLLVDKMSKMIKLNCSEDKYGNYTIQASGQLLVDGGNYVQLTTAKTMDTAAAEDNFGLEKTYVYVEGSSQRLNFSSGEIKGLIDARDDSNFGIAAYLEKLNTMSKFLLKDFNELHNTGYDLNNNQGQNFFGQSATNYSTDWPPSFAAPGQGTWLSQLKVNDSLFGTNGTSLIAAKTLAEIKQSNANGGRAILTGNYSYSGTAPQQFQVTITGMDGTKAGKVDGISCTITTGNPPVTTTAAVTKVSGDPNRFEIEYEPGKKITIAMNNNAFTKSGDTYTFTPVQGNGIGDNAVKLAEGLKTGMRSADIFGQDYNSTLEDASLDTYYGSVSGALGVQSQNAQRLSDNQTTLVKQITQWRESASGVNMDEEMTNMIRFQKGYSAAARVITTMDSMLDKLINDTGMVGR